MGKAECYVYMLWRSVFGNARHCGGNVHFVCKAFRFGESVLCGKRRSNGHLCRRGAFGDQKTEKLKTAAYRFDVPLFCLLNNLRSF